MRGALSYARILLQRRDDELALVRRDDAFDDVVAWLARYRGNMVVDATYERSRPFISDAQVGMGSPLRLQATSQA